MEIADNVLRHHLRNVLWIGGGACGGKTTAADRMAARHNLAVYHSDDTSGAHRSLASPCYQPTMTRPVAGWEAFFNRPVSEYTDWICGACDEQFNFIVCDLIRLAADRTVVADGCFTGSFLARISEPSRVAFMFSEPSLIRSLYFARDDKADMLGVLQSLPNPSAATENVLNVGVAHSQRLIEGAMSAGFRCWTRTPEDDPDTIITAVERHFGLK